MQETDTARGIVSACVTNSLHIILDSQEALESGIGSAGHASGEGSFLERRLVAGGSSMVQELRKLPALSKCCAVNGILSILPTGALRQQFVLLNPPGSGLPEGEPLQQSIASNPGPLCLERPPQCDVSALLLQYCLSDSLALSVSLPTKHGKQC